MTRKRALSYDLSLKKMSEHDWDTVKLAALLGLREIEMLEAKEKHELWEAITPDHAGREREGWDELNAILPRPARLKRI
jgi:hypothetical protein